MEYTEFSAKTVNDAIIDACAKLGVTSDRLDYEVIEEGSSGFLGIGAKPAIIKAAAKEEKPVVAEEVKAPEAAVSVTEEVTKEAAVNENKESKKSAPVDVETAKTLAKNFLDGVFGAMNMTVDIRITFDETENNMDIELAGDEMGVLIGKRGATLDSLQYLVSLVVNKDVDNYIRVKVDTENYRERRKETLENLARNVAFKVKRTRRSFSLEPMNPYERRIIHSALQNDRYVTTHSEGEEPNRKVVVTLKDDNRDGYSRGRRY